jgi:hypothetical protein
MLDTSLPRNCGATAGMIWQYSKRGDYSEITQSFGVKTPSDGSGITHGRFDMRYILSPILATLTICAFASVMPAAAGSSGDANGMRAQAQTHPDEANQNPDYMPGFVAQGEVYPPGVLLNGHFDRSRFAAATALAPFATDCHMYRTDLYGGWWFTACGPQ